MKQPQLLLKRNKNKKLLILKLKKMLKSFQMLRRKKMKKMH